MAKKVLLIGGTGAMGVYLTPELIRRGYQVDVTTRGHHRSGINLKYLHGDARNKKFIEGVLKRKYDVIVDFMVYSTDEFKERADMLLESTSHYVFLSTYRVFANEDAVITETSPRLLDVLIDKEYLQTDEYALQKARQEDALRAHSSKHWTIVRPSITYSKKRFQLGVLEAPYFVARAIDGKATVFPEEMLDKYTTMTWAGDVAKMIASLVLNKSAMSQDYNVVTSEHYTWAQVIGFYRDAIGLRVKIIPLVDFLKIYPGKYQVMYDRMFDRVMDNSKILKITNMKQSDLKSLGSGLAYELERFVKRPDFGNFDDSLNMRIDHVTDKLISKARKRIRLKTRIRSVRRKARVRTRLEDTKRMVRIRTRIREINRVRLNRSKAGLIVTLTSVFNYGNIIQRYALKSYLHKQGYDFDSVNTPSWVDGVGDEVFGYPREFVAKYIGGEMLNQNIHKGYERYLVGSDQVWRNWYGDDWSQLAPYFLDFVKGEDARRISYAASFGVDSLEEAGIDDELKEMIRPHLEGFDYISVREASGVEMVKCITGDDSKKVVTVADPTLLLEANDYSLLIEQSQYARHKTGRVFSYLLDKTTKKEVFVKKIASNYDGDYQIINPDVELKYEPVEIWLKGFRDADVVVTDSFHGAVFAIINKKDFIVINNEMRGSARFITLLQSLDLPTDRLIDESALPDMDINTLSEIDWLDVDSKLKKLRKRSSQWLLDALNG